MRAHPHAPGRGGGVGAGAGVCGWTDGRMDGRTEGRAAGTGPRPSVWAGSPKASPRGRGEAEVEETRPWGGARCPRWGLPCPRGAGGGRGDATGGKWRPPRVPAPGARPGILQQRLRCRTAPHGRGLGGTTVLHGMPAPQDAVPITPPAAGTPPGWGGCSAVSGPPQHHPAPCTLPVASRGRGTVPTAWHTSGACGCPGRGVTGLCPPPAVCRREGGRGGRGGGSAAVCIPAQEAAVPQPRRGPPSGTKY